MLKLKNLSHVFLLSALVAGTGFIADKSYAADSDPYEYDFTTDNRFPTIVPDKKAVVGPTAVVVPSIGPSRAVIGPSRAPSSEKQGESQTAGLIALHAITKNNMATVATDAKLIRDSIALSLQTGTDPLDSINCFSGSFPMRFKGRCDQLVIMKKTFDELQSQLGTLERTVTSLDSTIMFNKMGVDGSALSTTAIPRGNADVFATDKTTPDCDNPSLAGWKCLKTILTTYDGKQYNVLLKWTRPNQKSVATIFLGLGGDATYEPINDPLQRALFTNQLGELDGIRTVSLQMIDPPPPGQEQGGYWIYGGGYHNLGQIFMAGYALAIKHNLIQGQYTNYYGGSNGTMMLASAMARYNADIFFDRVVFQAGPFLPNLKNACNKHSKSSFYRSPLDKAKFVINIMSIWSFIFPEKYDLCDPGTPDNMSLLRADSKTNYPNTIFHVVMGAKEVTDPFGQWILDSNEEWYNSITAKSKERMVRSYVGHDTSYEDARRFLKLAPNEIPDKGYDQCKVTKTGNKTISCACGSNKEADLTPEGCFSLPKDTSKDASSCKKGTFTANGGLFEFSCGCGEVAGGVLQNDGCYHRKI